MVIVRASARARALVVLLAVSAVLGGCSDGGDGSSWPSGVLGSVVRVGVVALLVVAIVVLLIAFALVVIAPLVRALLALRAARDRRRGG